VDLEPLFILRDCEGIMQWVHKTSERSLLASLRNDDRAITFRRQIEFADDHKSL